MINIIVNSSHKTNTILVLVCGLRSAKSEIDLKNDPEKSK